MKYLSILATFLLVAVLAGCTFGSTAEPAETTDTVDTTDTTVAPVTTPSAGSLTVDLEEYSFSPATITLAAGETTSLTLTNSGRIEHTFVVTELGINETVAAGQSTTIEITPSEAGTFELECTVIGHLELGMHGTVIVQ